MHVWACSSWDPSCQEHPGGDSCISSICQPTCFGALYTKGAIAKYLGMFWAALHLCHLGTKTWALVGTKQQCPGVHYLLATLWDGLVWARGPGLIEVAGQLGCSDCTGLCFQSKVECKLYMFTQSSQADSSVIVAHLNCSFFFF